MRTRSLALLAALAVGPQPTASTATPSWEPAPPPDESEPAPRLVRRSQQRGATWLTLDRTLFQEDDTIRGRAWRLTANRIVMPSAWTYTLIDGQSQTRVTIEGDDTLRMPLTGLPGGVYTLRARTAGFTTEREITIASYEPPRIAKDLVFFERSYAPGDELAASLQLDDAMGGPVAGATIEAWLMVGTSALGVQEVVSDERGGAALFAQLPHQLPPMPVRWHLRVRKDGLVESTSREVPVVTRPPSVHLEPEAGALVVGLPSRLFVRVQDPDDGLIAASGQLVDDLGRVHGVFDTHDGLARLELTPEPDRDYRVQLLGQQPSTSNALRAMPEGCTLASFDDTESQEDVLRIAVRCATETEFQVSASMSGMLFGQRHATAQPGDTTILYLEMPDDLVDRSGMVHVELGRGDWVWARRHLYRHGRRGLGVTLEVLGDHHGPGDTVEVRVTTTDPSGRGVPATLAFGVIDDLVHEHVDLRGISLPSAIGLGASAESVRHPDRLFDHSVALDWFLGGVHSPLPGFFVQTEDVAVGRVLSKEFLESIPTGRTYQQAVQTVAGVSGGSNPNISGSASNDNIYLLDGDAVDAAEDGPVRHRVEDTLYFDPNLQTDADGHAIVRFSASNALSTLRISAEGVGDGWLGRGETTTPIAMPLSVDTIVPPVVRVGDVVELPVFTVNRGDAAVRATVGISAPEGLRLASPRLKQQVRAGARATDHVSMEVVDAGSGTITVRTEADGRTDAMARPIRAIPVGYDARWTASGSLTTRWTTPVDLSDALPGSIDAVLTLHPSPLSSLMEGVEGMMRQPHGCFEQASSANYPNVMILDYLRSSGTADAGTVRKARTLLDSGYARLTSYESPQRGYEWFGQHPGHEALTAYGLTQFLAMQRAWGAVDPGMIERTEAWLLGRRDGEGGYHQSSKAIDSFGRASAELTDAYITWSLAQAGRHDVLHAELARMHTLAQDTRDPYLLAMATDTLVLAGKPPFDAARRLAAMQDPDGSFPGAASSITRSGGMGLLVETTALAAIALMDFEDTRPSAKDAVDWLVAHRQGATWGSTQATILALQAITTHTRQGTGAHTVQVMVDGARVRTVEFARRETLARHIPLELTPGRHRIELRPSRESSVTVAAEVRYTTEEATDHGPLRLSTELSSPQVEMGEPVQLHAVVRNDTTQTVASPLVRVRYPGGLEPDLRQLRALEGEQGLALVETRSGEIALYLRGMGPHAEAAFTLDLVAAVPGRYTSAPSTAYPYYEEESVSWAPPTSVQVTVPK